TAPDRTMSPLSARSTPRPPWLTQPIGKTCTTPLRRASATMYSVTDRPSFQGSVFGMHATDVKPPTAAARVPLSIDSLCSCPGSRRCTCMSTRPGQTQCPVASRTRPSEGAPPRPFSGKRRSAMRPSTTRRSMRSSVFVAGSITRPPLISKLAKRASRQQVQDGHPHGDAVGDLLQDDRIRAVRHRAVDLDAAVHRPGMHDDDVGAGPPRALGGQAEQVVVLARGGEGPPPLPLPLDAQHHDHRGPLDRLVDPERHPDPQTRQPDGRYGRPP